MGAVFPDSYPVKQGYGVEHGFQIVVPVRALLCYVESKVYLGAGGYCIHRDDLLLSILLIVNEIRVDEQTSRYAFLELTRYEQTRLIFDETRVDKEYV